VNTEKREPLLKIEGLGKRYHRRMVLNKINLNLYAGETIIIMGPSGCGKSTLVRCINRLTEPDEGRIFFDGVDVTGISMAKLAEMRKKIGFVFQQFNLIRRLNVLENVTFALRVYGLSKDEAEEKGITALSRVGMAERVSSYPAELSGGEQQRVGIARALVLKPRLMLWDEPTAALDPILVGEVLDIMEDLVREKETTMLVVTHEVGFARRAADRIILLDHGNIVEEGTPEKIFTEPRSEIGEKYKKLLKN
jgi:polar amino acid transport system ATP-binding protein